MDMDMYMSESISQLQKGYYSETNKKPTIEELVKNKNNKHRIPSKCLTMLYTSGICQLCKHPEGHTHTYTLNLNCNYGDDKYGFIVCGKSECNLYIKTYRNMLYHNLHITKKWKELLVKRANNIFVSVTRSNGTIETDWSLCTNDEKTSSVYDIIMTLILCCNQNTIIITSDISDYIYKLLLNLYSDDIHLTFENILNRDNNLELTSLIRIFKGDLCKKVNIDLL